MTDENAAHSLRGLANDLRDASDSAILRVTQVVDTLPVRGDTDRLLEALRPRLATLRPPRPRTLCRVLFAPLDPVIVSGGDWRLGDASIPRSALAPIAALIRQHLPDGAAVEASVAAGCEPDAQVWLHAASILADQPMPAEWSLPAFQARTGLKAHAMQPLLAVIRLVFAHATVLGPSRQEHERGSRAIRPLLMDAARSGPLAWSIILALLFEQTTVPAALVHDVLTLARETAFARQLEHGLQTVVRTVIDRLDRSPAPAGPTPAGVLTNEDLHGQARRAARLAGFAALREDMLASPGRLAQRRRQVAALCSAQLVEGLRGASEACVSSGPLTPDAEDASAERLEGRLWALRRLDLAARPLGDANDREQILAEAASFYASDAAPDWLTQSDRLRLCEILVGAEAALRLTNA